MFGGYKLGLIWGQISYILGKPAKFPSPAMEDSSMVFPQFQDLSLPKRHGSTQMHCNWLDSISCASQQHRSTCKSSDLSQRSLFQSSVAQIGRNWNSGSQLWPHTRLSCGALKMYSGPGSTSDQWNLWPRIYYLKKSPQVFLLCG